jgi:pimeloyl-ACP methyl ester carboxylesterase
VVFAYGTSTWSFLYREPLRALRDRYRCIAIDHLGFGLSDKPAHGSSAKLAPVDHARRLSALLSHLRLERYTLVVHDFGGPIGLAGALEAPERLEGLVVINTWAWGTDNDLAASRIGSLLRTFVGAFLYLWLNFSVRVLLPSLLSRKENWTPSVKAHYVMPFCKRRFRAGPLALGRALDSPWYGTLWERREALRQVPLTLVWGLADKAFTATHLAKWKNAFPEADVVELEGVGHFPQEEAPEAVLAALEKALSHAM